MYKNQNIVVSYLLISESKALGMIPHVAEIAPGRQNYSKVQTKERGLFKIIQNCYLKLFKGSDQRERISPDHLVRFLLKAGFKAVQSRLALFLIHFKF